MATHHIPSDVRWNATLDDGMWQHMAGKGDWRKCKGDLAECGREDGLSLIGKTGHVTVHPEVTTVTLRKGMKVTLKALGAGVPQERAYITNLDSLEDGHVMVAILDPSEQFIDGNRGELEIPVDNILSPARVALTRSGLGRVLNGSIGREYDVDAFTKGAAGAVAHVRAMAQERSAQMSSAGDRAFNIWSLGAEDYELVAGSIPVFPCELHGLAAMHVDGRCITCVQGS